ncbi:nucleoside-binding protein [Mycoplasma testudineum]|uniref:Nucleoside-binding protein n=1 Tax=Mycoplasma testudineum TaxID=244584 RepID=A0A4R6ID91_9MOLU|nr:BMP family ABC transporter substrate-binding protein [Mycoplasma testudineum]OYD26748.1 hypothetical protein CG473_02220 [Mycoplasma testudineum]TDO19884.1 nucleoside-binding protein [Mycoplasma testudineum]
MKIKFKKMLLIGVAPMAMAGVAIAAISCGQGKTDRAQIINLTETITGITGSTIETAANKVLTDNIANLKTFHIGIFTAGGAVTDKSFNQSSYEAAVLLNNKIVELNPDAKISVTPHDEPASDDTSLGNTYTAGLKNGENIWVLSGFQHGSAFANWYKIASNKASFDAAKITVIGIDWSADPAVAPGRIITLNYKTQEAGYIAGYASGKYLAETYPSDASKRVLATFGGAEFPGVTDFIDGYLAGAAKWNSENPTLKSTWYAKGVRLDTGFNPSVQENSTKVRGVVNAASKPQLIFSVSGPFTGTVIETITANNSEAKVIGVDADQSLSFAASRNLFFSSVTKNIGLSLYQVLAPLAVGFYTDELIKISGFVDGTTNGALKEGVSRDFVGVTKTYLPSAADQVAQAALDAGRAKFLADAAASGGITYAQKGTAEEVFFYVDFIKANF